MNGKIPTRTGLITLTRISSSDCTLSWTTTTLGDRYNDEHVRGPKQFFRGKRGGIDDLDMAYYYECTGIQDPWEL